MLYKIAGIKNDDEYNWERAVHPEMDITQMNARMIADMMRNLRNAHW